MRQYKIQKVELGYILRKEYKENDIIDTVLYWNGRWRDYRKDSAKIYYFEDNAIGGLIYARKYGGNEPC